MNGFEIIGYMAGLFTAVCFMPQSIKTLRTRETKGISAVSYALFSLGLICWIIYGVYLHSIQMILFNAISLVFSLSILVVTLCNLRVK
ncbi:MAG: SemiSWEET transporter [Acetobacter sp.]|nr:SemiSWEET transporter [Acetobacter sp.]